MGSGSRLLSQSRRHEIPSQHSGYFYSLLLFLCFLVPLIISFFAFQWFKGGITNISYNCLDRIVESGGGDKIALFWEANDPGSDASLTYKQLLSRVCQLSNYLKDIGVKKGDAVVVYLPMLMELPITMLACARIGAVHSVFPLLLFFITFISIFFSFFFSFQPSTYEIPCLFRLFLQDFLQNLLLSESSTANQNLSSLAMLSRGVLRSSTSKTLLMRPSSYPPKPTFP